MQDTQEFTPARIKLIRTKLRLSRAQFAEKYGVSETAVEKWETGASTPLFARTIGGLLLAAEDAEA
jgi:DNA-binding transcriptional regulator YiaG